MLQKIPDSVTVFQNILERFQTFQNRKSPRWSRTVQNILEHPRTFLNILEYSKAFSNILEYYKAFSNILKHSRILWSVSATLALYSELHYRLPIRNPLVRSSLLTRIYLQTKSLQFPSETFFMDGGLWATIPHNPQGDLVCVGLQNHSGTNGQTTLEFLIYIDLINLLIKF